MDKIDFSNAVYPQSQPMLEQSFDFMQNGSRKAINEIFKGNNNGQYTTNDVVILYGCKNSTPGGSTFTISAGAVMYNGEIYPVDATTFTCGGGQTAVATIDITYDSVDPIKLRPSGTSVYVHQIRKVAISSAVSGSGISDFNSFKYGYGLTTTTTDNGESVTGNITGSGPFAYSTLTTKYAYRIENGFCDLNFNISFLTTDGAKFDRLDIPLPEGIIKDTSYGADYPCYGTCRYTAPSATSDYGGLQVVSDFGGVEGQRLSLVRIENQTEFTWETGKTVTLKGRIKFPIVVN